MKCVNNIKEKKRNRQERIFTCVVLWALWYQKKKKNHFVSTYFAFSFKEIVSESRKKMSIQFVTFWLEYKNIIWIEMQLNYFKVQHCIYFRSQKNKLNRPNVAGAVLHTTVLWVLNYLMAFLAFLLNLWTLTW